MKSYNALFLALAFVLSAPALAVEQTINSATITGIRAFPDGSFYLTLSTHGTCTNTATPKRFFSDDGVVNGVTTTADGVKALYALALTAYTSQKSIKIWFENSANCNVNGILIL